MMGNEPMKLLSWNILQGGGTRASRLRAAITAHDPDVILVSEFRTKPGAALCGAIQAKGWPYVESTDPLGSENGLCILSRTPLRVPELALRRLSTPFGGWMWTCQSTASGSVCSTSSALEPLGSGRNALGCGA
jgi:hypothetical protein